MMNHFGKRALAFLVVALVAVPLADARVADKTSYSDTVYCPLTYCSVSVTNNAYSDSDYDCVGSPGAFQACTVYHSCTSVANGAVLTTGYVRCYSEISAGTAGSCQALLGGQCWSYADEPQVLVYAGWCVKFYADGTVSSTPYSASASAPPVTICVNANGPY